MSTLAKIPLLLPAAVLMVFSSSIVLGGAHTTTDFILVAVLSGTAGGLLACVDSDPERRRRWRRPTAICAVGLGAAGIALTYDEPDQRRLLVMVVIAAAVQFPRLLFIGRGGYARRHPHVVRAPLGILALPFVFVIDQLWWSLAIVLFCEAYGELVGWYFAVRGETVAPVPDAEPEPHA
jgi:hypothetical protein